ncbi:zinc finger BED domain-containing protein 5-like [Macrobrachium nipponense]|uniref:zinc finger BED domain-containing protein 5-like n=1 Tax=Macrobrachium nipponense TaxID=159736 RepID=UPI0030C8A64A
MASQQLRSSTHHFKKYFLEESDLEQYDWIRMPFTAPGNHSSSDLEEVLLELSSDRTLRLKFESTTFNEFWISVSEEYPGLSKAALNILTPFGSTYLCETTFFALTYIKNKYRSRLNVKDDLRVTVSDITPRFEMLCSKKQAHSSH